MSSSSRVSWGAVGVCNLDGGLCTQACYRTSTAIEALGSSDNAPQPVAGEAGELKAIAAFLYPYVVEE